jgi:hypothetical protein
MCSMTGSVDDHCMTKQVQESARPPIMSIERYGTPGGGAVSYQSAVEPRPYRDPLEPSQVRIRRRSRCRSSRCPSGWRDGCDGALESSSNT